MPGWAHAEQSIANSQSLLGKMAKQVGAYAKDRVPAHGIAGRAHNP